MNIIKALDSFVDQYCDSKSKILVAVSGGVDSIVLAHLFCHYTELDIAIAHVNYQLRGDDSDQDEALVCDLAKSLEIPYHVKAFDTAQIAQQQGQSIQMVARSLRYQWFGSLCEQYGYQQIATAHHLNDSLETALFNLTKGTGIAGLKGIKPTRGEIPRVIRPLIHVTKEQISLFAQQNGLHWREDVSNTSNKYARNLIRNEVLPILKRLNPNIEHTFVDTQKRLIAADSIVQHFVQAFKDEALIKEADHTKIKIEALKQWDQEVQVLTLWEAIRDYGFSFVDTKGMIEALDQFAGKTFLSRDFVLVKDRDSLVITPREEANTKTLLLDWSKPSPTSSSLGWERVEVTEDFQIPRDPQVACLDWAKCQGEVIIRDWVAGDRFCPLGMKGQKKIADFLAEQKIPLNLKSKYKVLCINGQIAWLISLRVDDRFKITTTTDEALIIQHIRSL